MQKLSLTKAGIAVGTFIGLWHLAWASLVAAGWAGPLLDFVLRLHFIHLQYELAPFAIGTAAALVALTSCVGALFGIVFAVIWNWLARTTPDGEKLAHGSARP